MKEKLISHLLVGSGVGAGGAMVLALTHSVAQKPELLIDALKGFGAPFLFGVIAIVLLNQKAGDVLTVMRESAAAQQGLTDAVNRNVERDDRRAQAMDLTIQQLARQGEHTAERLEAIWNELRTKRAAAAAGD
jgi:hypothetical protein